MKGPYRLQGKFLQPGKTIPEADLWPGPDWPKVPILLEICASQRGRNLTDYIVWRYEGGEFREVVGLRGRDAGAWLDLDPILEHLLSESREGLPDPDVSAAAHRVTESLEHELSDLDHSFRQKLLDSVYEALMVRACAEVAAAGV